MIPRYLKAGKQGSVREISARFTGSSKVESIAQYEQRRKVYQKILLSSNYAKTGFKKIASPMKQKMMRRWTAVIQSENLGVALDAESAKEFLAQHGVTSENVDERDWNEWLEAIDFATSNPSTDISASFYSKTENEEPVNLDADFEFVQADDDRNIEDNDCNVCNKGKESTNLTTEMNCDLNHEKSKEVDNHTVEDKDSMPIIIIESVNPLGTLINDESERSRAEQPQSPGNADDVHNPISGKRIGGNSTEPTILEDSSMYNKPDLLHNREVNSLSTKPIQAKSESEKHISHTPLQTSKEPEQETSQRHGLFSCCFSKRSKG